MSKVDLVSKDWCNIIFEDRNQDYGAYQIRKNAGRRYKLSLLIILGFFAFWGISSALLELYIYYQIKEGLKDMERFGSVDMPKIEPGHVIKTVALGRHLVQTSAVRAPYATMQAPKIVDFNPNPFLMGEKGLEDLTADDTQKIITLKDTTGLENDPKAPIIGEQLTPTEVVEQMPQFPGGPAILMRWLDANIPYPPECVKAKITGEVEATFLVAPDGSVLEPAISKSLHPVLDKVVLAALKKMPKWHPGRMKGKKVLVRVTIPIMFNLDQ